MQNTHTLISHTHPDVLAERLQPLRGIQVSAIHCLLQLTCGQRTKDDMMRSQQTIATARNQRKRRRQVMQAPGRHACCFETAVPIYKLLEPNEIDDADRSCCRPHMQLATRMQ